MTRSLVSATLAVALLVMLGCGKSEEESFLDTTVADPPPQLQTTLAPFDPFTTDTGVAHEIVNGDFRTCWTDADVLVKDMRVHEVMRKGRLIEIEVGEPIIADFDLPDYDEIYLTHPVYRDQSGNLMIGYRECAVHPRCYTDAFVLIADGTIQKVMSQGVGTEVRVGEAVRGEPTQGPFYMYPVYRAADSVMEIGSRHCDPARQSPSELETGDVSFLTP